MRGQPNYYESVNPDYDKASQFVYCEAPTRPADESSGFPVVWANHSTAPITFAVCLVLILYFAGEIVRYIRSRKAA